MVFVLAKCLIKKTENASESELRQKYGILCGSAGMIFNALLFAAKLCAGLFTKSVSVIADAFNNLSDAFSSVITMIGFKMSMKAPDKEHPFGHGRMEYIAGLIISLLILLFGVELFKSSFMAVIKPEKPDVSLLSIFVLCASILIKLYMFFYNLFFSKKISSATLKAAALDSISDCVSTFVVLFCAVISLVFPKLKIPFDGIAGLVVAVFILQEGISSIKETIDPLLGIPLDKDFAVKIEKIVLAHKPVFAVHDLIIHDYGPERRMITLHAEVPGNYNVLELHQIIDAAEEEVEQKLGCSCTIHMDPVDLSDKEIFQLKDFLAEEIKRIDPEVTFHDVRIRTEKNVTKVSFDAIRPYGCVYTKDELKKLLVKVVSRFNKNWEISVKIDDPMI